MILFLPLSFHSASAFYAAIRGALTKSLGLLCAMGVLAGAVHAADEEWLVVEDSATNKIFLQKSSIQTVGGSTAFVYRVDFTDVQTNTKTGKEYRSVVVKAAFLCLGGQLVRGEVNAYAEVGGAGESRGNFVPTGDQARPFGVVRGSSDDRLRTAVCARNSPPKP